MTGNPVPCENDGKSMDMGPQASRLRMTKGIALTVGVRLRLTANLHSGASQ